MAAAYRFGGAAPAVRCACMAPIPTSSSSRSATAFSARVGSPLFEKLFLCLRKASLIAVKHRLQRRRPTNAARSAAHCGRRRDVRPLDGAWRGNYDASARLRCARHAHDRRRLRVRLVLLRFVHCSTRVALPFDRNARGVIGALAGGLGRACHQGPCLRLLHRPRGSPLAAQSRPEPPSRSRPRRLPEPMPHQPGRHRPRAAALHGALMVFSSRLP